MPIVTHSQLRTIPDEAKEFFIYTTTVDGVSLGTTLNGTATTTIRFTQESHFVAIKFVAEAVESDGTAYTNYFIQLEPSEGDRRLQNDWVRANNFVGTAQLPMIMPQPRLFLANTVLTIRTRQGGTTAATAYFSLIGFKLFYDPNQLDLTSRRS